MLCVPRLMLELVYNIFCYSYVIVHQVLNIFYKVSLLNGDITKLYL